MFTSPVLNSAGYDVYLGDPATSTFNIADYETFQDTVSQGNGTPADGLTFCGPRSYTMTPSWAVTDWTAGVLTIDDSAT